jgi:solute carrier family 25 S-adenosylmethionine transporter 26
MECVIGGAVAGCTIDVSLFPIDTIKTRMQSQRGFRGSGGFNGVYAGLTPVLAASLPGGAIFFGVYEESKRRLAAAGCNGAVTQLTSSSLAECAACLVRVPMEQAKQRMQVDRSLRAMACARQCAAGGFGGLYAGYAVMISREIPFSMLQFSIYEQLKLSAWGDSVAMCGAYGFVAGGISGLLTTPIDVAKTRIMLQDPAATGTWVHVVARIFRQDGVAALFRGVGPRVAYISIGGTVFLGSYEATVATLRS